jgi:hypothetical protein
MEYTFATAPILSRNGANVLSAAAESMDATTSCHNKEETRETRTVAAQNNTHRHSIVAR